MRSVFMLCCSAMFLVAVKLNQNTIYIYHHTPNRQQTTLVSLSGNNELKYGLYANKGEKAKTNMLPDFSFAGFRGGGVPLPNLPVRITLSAVPGDNREQIQEAINQVSKMPPDHQGFRGKVLLKAGTYLVAGTLRIKAGGVVLAGEGQHEQGSVLKAIKKAKHTLVVVGEETAKPSKHKNTLVPITSSYIPTGAISFGVSSTAGFRVGDTVLVKKTPNTNWLLQLDMSRYGWKAESFAMEYERIIKALDKYTITVNVPIIDPIRQNEGGGQVMKVSCNRSTKNSGVENLRLVSSYRDNEDEEHAWEGVVMQMAENCWVKKVTVQYFGYSCVTVDRKSAYNTIEDCVFLDPKSMTKGKRKYSFYIQSGSFNLFQRCYARGGRHDYVTGSRVAGPNVFLDCYSTASHAGTGPHQRWATGTLFDNITGGEMEVRNRMASGTGHGWAGAQTMFWNCVSTSKKGITVESPPGSVNWLVGGKASTISGNGYQELFGKIVLPRSIYLAQLEARLGKAAVEKTTTKPQRDTTRNLSSLDHEM